MRSLFISRMYCRFRKHDCQLKQIIHFVWKKQPGMWNGHEFLPLTHYQRDVRFLNSPPPFLPSLPITYSIMTTPNIIFVSGNIMKCTFEHAPRILMHCKPISPHNHYISGPNIDAQKFNLVSVSRRLKGRRLVCFSVLQHGIGQEVRLTITIYTSQHCSMLSLDIYFRKVIFHQSLFSLGLAL